MGHYGGGSPSEGREAIRVRLATSFFARVRGLLLTDEGDVQSEALLIAPCSSVHTVMMRYALDIAFVGSDGRVLRSIEDVRPGRMRLACRGAVAVLERPSSCCGAWPRVGERIVWSSTSEETNNGAVQ